MTNKAENITQEVVTPIMERPNGRPRRKKRDVYVTKDMIEMLRQMPEPLLKKILPYEKFGGLDERDFKRIIKLMGDEDAVSIAIRKDLSVLDIHAMIVLIKVMKMHEETIDGKLTPTPEQFKAAKEMQALAMGRLPKVTGYIPQIEFDGRRWKISTQRTDWQVVDDELHYVPTLKKYRDRRLCEQSPDGTCFLSKARNLQTGTEGIHNVLPKTETPGPGYDPEDLDTS